MAASATFRFYPVGNLNVALGDIHLTPGFGKHNLTVVTQMSANWLADDDPRATVPALISGSVTTDQPSYKWFAGLQPRVAALRSYLAAEELSLDLADEQLVALERERSHGDVVLRFNLQVTLLTPVADVHPIAEEQVAYRIPAEKWLALLDQVGSEVGIVVRVPSPLTDPSLGTLHDGPSADVASLTQATRRLRQARAELRDGQYEHCVATCRRVLENLALLMDLPKAKPVFAKTAEDRDQGERRAAIYYDVKAMASAAHHDDDTTVGFTWRLADAEAVLAMTAGLLLWLE